MTFFAWPPLRRMFKPTARTWLLGLAWLAMVGRAVVPTGYMPVGQGGTHWLSVCSGSGQARVVAVALFGDSSEDRGDAAQQTMHCAFAAQAAGQALPAVTFRPGVAAAPAGADWAPPLHFLFPRYVERGTPLGARAPPYAA